MNGLFTEEVKVVKGLAPSVDLIAGGVATDVVNMEGYQKAVFLFYLADAAGGGALGVGTFTVDACDDTTPSTTAKMPFVHRKLTTGVSEVISSPAFKTAAESVATIAGESTIHIIEVDAADLTSSGYSYVRLAIAETENDPVMGCCIVLLVGGRAKGDRLPTALT